MNSTIKNKRFCTFTIFLIAIISAAVAVSPAFIAAALPDHLWWILVIFIPPCVAQVFCVAMPIMNTLQEYQKASSKRGLIHEQDIYKLFEKNGTAKLHVADIDKLPRYNVDIPDTKYQLFTETIPVIEDSSGTERNIERSYVRCLHCDYTFPSTVIDDEDFKHCPCCGHRITRYRVPKDWYKKRAGLVCENTTWKPESVANKMREK